MDTPGIVLFPGNYDSLDSLVREGNGLVATLTANISAGQASFGISSTAGWPVTGIATIQKRVAKDLGGETVYLPIGALEIITFETSGSNLINVLRGQQGTADVPHDVDDYIECRITALNISAVKNALRAVQLKLGKDASLPAIGKQLVGTATGSGWQDRTYRHVQGAAATVWNITHNLASRPAVTIVDSAGRVVIGDVEYLDDNNIRLTFSAAFGGEAYLN